MKYMTAALLLLVSSVSVAKEPTPVGEGKFMLSDQSMTIFGSTDKIVAKLMKQAQEFCQTTSGEEAVLLQSDGTEAVPGTINDSGRLHQAARGATGTIYFQCGAPGHVVSQSDRSTALDNLAKLKVLLDSGAITQDEYDAEKKKILGN